MKQVSIRGCWLLALVLAGTILLPAFSPAQSSRAVRSVPSVTKPARPAQKASEKRPDWKEIEKSIKSALAQTKDYRPGDLLAQDDAKKALQAAKKSGWTVAASHKLPERLLPASDELVRLFHGEKGTKFMRQIAGVPGGFDRLDKLRRQPNGSRRLQELMTQPDGYKLIEYLATTPAGRKTGRELSRGGRDFNATTKRIYTEGELLAALKVIYAEETSENSRKPAP